VIVDLDQIKNPLGKSLFKIPKKLIRPTFWHWFCRGIEPPDNTVIKETSKIHVAQVVAHQTTLGRIFGIPLLSSSILICDWLPSIRTARGQLLAYRQHRGINFH